MRHLLVLLIATPMLLAAAPQHMGEVVAPRPGDPCSASRMVTYKRSQKGLPPLVQKMRLAIIDACVKCNTTQLEKLALPGRKNFDFTFGKVKKPGTFWHHQDMAGHRILAKMVTTLRLPYAHDGHAFIWPSAYGKNPQERDWEVLGEMYAKRDIVLFRDYGGFTGMRIAIADDGDWLYAIEGD